MLPTPAICYSDEKETHSEAQGTRMSECREWRRKGEAQLSYMIALEPDLLL